MRERSNFLSRAVASFGILAITSWVVKPKFWVGALLASGLAFWTFHDSSCGYDQESISDMLIRYSTTNLTHHKDSDDKHKKHHKKHHDSDEMIIPKRQGSLSTTVDPDVETVPAFDSTNMQIDPNYPGVGVSVVDTTPPPQ